MPAAASSSGTLCLRTHPRSPPRPPVGLERPRQLSGNNASSSGTRAGCGDRPWNAVGEAQLL
eukprot:2189075-Pyramimonas_sp.AAC.1